MKRLLIPLLAALALPTAVNAEIIRLQCGGDGTMKVHEFNINEEANSVTIAVQDKLIKTKDLLVALDLFIFEFFNVSTLKTEVQIDR